MLAGREDWRLAGWYSAPDGSFPELLKNTLSQRAEILAMLLYIQGGPDEILKFGSGQVTNLTSFSNLCTVQNGKNS